MDLTDPVLISTALLGCVAGVVGTFAVLRRRALMGDLLSHTALPGLCLAFLIVGHSQFTGMLVGAFCTGLLGILCVTMICRWSRTKEDAAIGIVLSTFFGVGAVMSSMIQRMPTGGGKAGLERYIYGQAAGIGRQDLWWIGGVSVVALLVVLFLYKEFKVFSFDPEFAHAQGWPTLGLELTMMGTLAVVTMVGLPAVGVVLMAAMLITPAAAARFWTNRLGVMLVLAGAFGTVTGLGGTLLSAGVVKQWLGWDPLAFGYNTHSLPTGPLIVLCGAAVFIVSMLFAPERGIVARLWSAWRLRQRTARENLLRSLYELSEPRLPALPVISPRELMKERAWTVGHTRRLLARAAAQGWVTLSAGGAQLTPAGLDRAIDVTRTHRLWELFLIEGANIAADHVDRDADALEHLLPPEMVDHLEARLAAAGQLPSRDGKVPQSPHELTATAAATETPP